MQGVPRIREPWTAEEELTGLGGKLLNLDDVYEDVVALAVLAGAG